MRVPDPLRRSGLLAGADVDRVRRAGHFVYESGDHGDTWLALDLLFADPRRLQRVAARLAQKLVPHAPELICGPLVGGALVGQWVAHRLGVAFVFAELQARNPNSGASYAIPTGLRPLASGKRVIVVDDAINAGSAVDACRREIERCGGRVVAAAGLLVRTPGGLDLWQDRLPIEYLVGVPWETWQAADCPLCRAGVPITSPASAPSMAPQ